MSEDFKIHPSWDFLVNADKMDRKKVLSAWSIVLKSFLPSFNYKDLKGAALVQKILSTCYKNPSNVSYDQFIKDIATAHKIDSSNIKDIDGIELSLLQRFRKNILSEATDEELKILDLDCETEFELIDDKEGRQKAIKQNIDEIAGLLDIDLFTVNVDDVFFNEKPLVEKCYRAVVAKNLKSLNEQRWQQRSYDIIFGEFGQLFKRIRETFKNSKWISKLLMVIIFVIAIPVLLIIALLVVVLSLVYSPFRHVYYYIIDWLRLRKKEGREYNRNKTFKIDCILSLTILVVTFIYLRHREVSSYLEDCISELMALNKPFNDEFIAMSLVYKLYKYQRDNNEVGGTTTEDKTFQQVLQQMSKNLKPAGQLEQRLTQNLKESLDILYRSIDPERNIYYERIDIPEDSNKRILMVDYRFPFTNIQENTKFLKNKENDLYDELNRIYLYLMGQDLEEVMVEPKPGDTFDIIQVYDTDRAERFKQYLSENGKFIIVRTEEDIDRSTFLTTASDIRHVLGTAFTKQGIYIRRIKRHLENGKLEEYQSTVDLLMSNTEYIRRVISTYNGDIESTFMQAEKESLNVLNEIQDYVKNYETFGNKRFQILVNSEKMPLDTQVRVNKDHFFSTLDTILENAARHGFKGREDNPDNCVEVHLEKRLIESNAMVQISVKNNGKPSSVTLEQYTTRGRKYTESGNTGLGGYLIDLFVKANEGFMKLDSNDEWGFIVDIYLPIVN